MIMVISKGRWGGGGGALPPLVSLSRLREVNKRIVEFMTLFCSDNLKTSVQSIICVQENSAAFLKCSFSWACA